MGLEKISLGNGYKINENTIIIFKQDIYYIGSQFFNKSIIVNVSCTIVITNSTFMNTNSSLSPFITEEDKEVILKLNSKTVIIDSPLNENNAIIYLKKGVKLTIESYNYYESSSLTLFPKSLYAIRGEDESLLTIKNCDIKIISLSNNSGGIFIKKGIFFENLSAFYFKSLFGNMLQLSVKIKFG